MLKVDKLNRLEDVENLKLLDELCLWIDKNLDSSIGINDLVEQTKLSNKDLQYLFEKYKQTTPMTYIRKQREIARINLENKNKYLITKERITPIFWGKEIE
jgi:transcriptional regulator GlxA family with amidase domain